MDEEYIIHNNDIKNISKLKSSVNEMIGCNQSYVISMKDMCDRRSDNVKHLSYGYINSLNRIISLKSVKEISELEPSISIFNEYIKILNHEFENLNKNIYELNKMLIETDIKNKELVAINNSCNK